MQVDKEHSEQENSTYGSALQVDEEQSVPVNLQTENVFEKDNLDRSGSEVDEEQSIPGHLQTESTVEKEQSANCSGSQVGDVSKEQKQNENGIAVELKKKPKLKPKRPCVFCCSLDSRLPRHILTKHRTEPLVQPLINLPREEQLHRIAFFRRDGIKQHNLNEIEGGGSNFMRERKACESEGPICVVAVMAFLAEAMLQGTKKYVQQLGITSWFQ